MYRFQVSADDGKGIVTITVDANCVDKAARIGFEQLKAEKVHVFSWTGLGEVSADFRKGERGKAIKVS